MDQSHTEHEHDEQLMRPDGQRYQAPESEESRESKTWAYAALAAVVVVLMLLIATGAVPVFSR